MLILILEGMSFYAVVVFTLGYDFLFKSILGHCVALSCGVLVHVIDISVVAELRTETSPS